MSFRGMAALVAMLLATSAPLAAAEGDTARAIEGMRGEIHGIFEDYRTEAHVPGMVYGIVADGRLVLMEGLGTRDPETKVPVDGDTRFRIASMSKVFTALAILKLRDEGKVALDAPADRYVPQLKKWKLPPGSRPITVRDLLHHTAGFVEDNPWGDRQQVLTPAEFTALIDGGMDFANAPGVRMEYSNYGYALLGRIVTNASGKRYQDYIRDTIMRPLGMNSTGFDIALSPPESRAIGYRWQDDRWVREPDMRDGEFGAMGGVETTASDYAKWIAFLLSAWPADGAADSGPVRRSTVRDLVTLASPRPAADRPAELGPPCRRSRAYGMGLGVVDDCELGQYLSHSGGYPGYGSFMMLVPEARVGAFVFNNLTYTSLDSAVAKSLLSLRRAGAIPDRARPVSDGLARAYELAKQAWRGGSVDGLPLANNVLMDSDAARRAEEIAKLKSQVGACAMREGIVPVSAMEGTFTWACERGSIDGRVQRAPTSELLLQVVDFAKAGG